MAEFAPSEPPSIDLNQARLLAGVVTRVIFEKQATLREHLGRKAVLLLHADLHEGLGNTVEKNRDFRRNHGVFKKMGKRPC
ncbi:MAG: hypothetical protein ACN4GG_01960 [Akkermansiaceae bacterium]